MVDTPFAIGEEFASKWQFLPYLERGILEYARLDIGNVGGFTEAMKVAGLAEAHYIDLMPHNPLGPLSTAANVHFAAAVPNYAYLEDRPEYFGNPVVFPKQHERVGAFYPVPGLDEPGLGVTVNEEWVVAAASEGFKCESHAFTAPSSRITYILSESLGCFVGGMPAGIDRLKATAGEMAATPMSR